MNKNIISAVFDSRSEAEAAVGELRNEGIDSGRLSIIGRDEQGTNVTDGSGESAEEGVGDTLKGALGGAGIGAILGVAALAIPGVGPLAAAGKRYGHRCAKGSRGPLRSEHRPRWRRRRQKCRRH